MRVILLVIDGCGVGALPDASEYGLTDPFSNTLGHVSESADLHLPNLASLGLGNITPMRNVPPVQNTRGGWGRCAELSKGKDSVTGHWEMMGIVTETAFPTYPNGFPQALIEQFEAAIGRKTLANYPASGTEIIKSLGQQHMETGFPIVYTSADSVFQIAAHEEIIPLETLYEYCEIARGMLIAPNNVQRVIARPFVGDQKSGFSRTENRRDYPLPPPEPNLLSELKAAGKNVCAIGVISELFPKSYFTHIERSRSNSEHMQAVYRAMERNDCDLIFANFEDFDMLYGHRNDVQGFANALNVFDEGLGNILADLNADDTLIITADHGNDPTTESTDHSREYTPLLIAGNDIPTGTNLGVLKGMNYIADKISGILLDR